MGVFRSAGVFWHLLINNVFQNSYFISEGNIHKGVCRAEYLALPFARIGII